MEFLILLTVKHRNRKKSRHILIARLGEQFAVIRLKALGFLIWEINYSNKFGEIDILASKGRTLYVVEVKTRKLKNIKSYSFRKQINQKKSRKLKTLIKMYKYQQISELKKRRIIDYKINLFGVAYEWKESLLPKFEYWELSEL